MKSQVNDLLGQAASEAEKEDNKDNTVDSAKARKEEQKRSLKDQEDWGDFLQSHFWTLLFFSRQEALQQYEEQRKKERQKAEYQREKLRDNVRQKYGIEKKPDARKKKSNVAMIQVSILAQCSVW